MRRHFIFIFTAIFLFIFSTTAHAVTFTGRAASDFPSGACITDPSIDAGGQDVQFVVAGAIRTSGFDATKLCISYDAASDTVQIGTLTHNNAANTEIITGDADGNGDPATVSSDLSGSGVQDIANFGSKEFFSLLFDFDFTVNNGFSIVTGKHADAAFSDYNVFTAANSNLDNTGTSVMYGATEGAALGSATFASPSASAPHLEFSIAHFKSIPGLALDWTDPNDTIGLYFTMGSYSDGAIGEELFPSKLDPRFYYRFYPLTVAHLLQTDADGDGIIDDLDKDDDGDGIADLIELGLKACDLDGDGVLSVSQDKDGDNLFDVGEEGEILKCSTGGFAAGGKDIVRKAAFAGGTYPDFDGDGTPNYLDTDSDNDGVLDKDEDKNGNGVVDPGETSPLNPDTDGDGISDKDELNKFKIDTDGDGLSDGEEVETYKTDPNKPDTDSDALNDGAEVKLHTTNPLKADTDGGGARDGLEIQRNTNPLDPTDDHIALADPALLPVTAETPGQPSASTIDPDLAGYSIDQVHVAGAGLTSCSLNPQAPVSHAAIILLLMPILFLFVRRFVIPAQIVILLLLSTSAHALTAQRQRLPVNGQGGVYLNNTQMLGKDNFDVDMDFQYVRRPLQVTTINGNTRIDNLVDYFVIQDTVLSYGLADWFDVSIAIQSSLVGDVEPLGSTTSTTQADFGDLAISTKFLLLDPVEAKFGFGLSLIPFATLPTGNDNRYLGDSGVTGGFKAVTERYFGRTDTYLSLGARFLSSDTILNTTVGNEFLFGAGAQHPLSTRHDIHALLEVNGSTTFSNFMTEQSSSPIEMTGGLRKFWVSRHLATTLSAGIGLDSGYGAPRARVMAGINYVYRGLTDRDQDGVADPGDYCPTRIADPEASGARPGCPGTHTRVIVKVIGDRILILQPINFETGSAKLLPDSEIVIEQVATVLNSTPQLQKVIVEGHTDNIGGPEFNQKLSEARAKTVVAGLVQRGVAADRLSARGWGYSRSLTSNTTEAGRAKNRRVEFHILEFASTSPKSAQRP